MRRPRTRALSNTIILLIPIVEIIDRFLSGVHTLFNPSIKLLDRFFKSGFAPSRFPVFQIARNNETFAADLHDRNAIFLNDSAEMARRIAGFICRAGNVQEVSLWLSLINSGFQMRTLRPGFCKQHANEFF